MLDKNTHTHQASRECSNMKCEKVTKVKGDFFGLSYKKYCQKDAVAKCSDGRFLCQKHYNKWVNKTNNNKKGIKNAR